MLLTQQFQWIFTWCKSYSSKLQMFPLSTVQKIILKLSYTRPETSFEMNCVNQIWHYPVALSLNETLIWHDICPSEQLIKPLKYYRSISFTNYNCMNNKPHPSFVKQISLIFYNLLWLCASFSGNQIEGVFL